MNKYSRAFFYRLERFSDWVDYWMWNVRQLFATGFAPYYMFVLTGIERFRYLDHLLELIEIAEYTVERYSEYELHKHHLNGLVDEFNREKYFWMKSK